MRDFVCERLGGFFFKLNLKTMGYPKSLILTMQAEDDVNLPFLDRINKLISAVEIYNSLNNTGFSSSDAFIHYITHECKQ